MWQLIFDSFISLSQNLFKLIVRFYKGQVCIWFYSFILKDYKTQHKFIVTFLPEDQIFLIIDIEIHKSTIWLIFDAKIKMVCLMVVVTLNKFKSNSVHNIGVLALLTEVIDHTSYNGNLIWRTVSHQVNVLIS